MDDGGKCEAPETHNSATVNDVVEVFLADVVILRYRVV